MKKAHRLHRLAQIIKKNQCNPGNLWASFFHRLRATANAVMRNCHENTFLPPAGSMLLHPIVEPVREICLTAASDPKPLGILPPAGSMLLHPIVEPVREICLTAASDPKPLGILPPAGRPHCVGEHLQCSVENLDS